MKLVSAFDELFDDFRPCFKRQTTFDRGRAMAYSTIVTYGRRTISRLICTKDEQDKDWSADYKFFSTRKWDTDDLFFEILKRCDRYSHWENGAIVIGMDDTLKKKTGKKIPGVSTLRDPMSPPFHINLVPGLRFIQATAIINPENRLETNRAVPIYFKEAAPAKKPPKNASQEVKEQYKIEQKKKRISEVGHQTIEKIREQIDQLPNGKERILYDVEDGSYCNGNFLKNPPEGVVHIVRGRKDMRLFRPIEDEPNKEVGRKKIYGERLPTPEQIRKDDSYPWKTAHIYAAGKYHDVRYKVVSPVLWQRGTKGQPQRLFIVAPLRYRKNKYSKLLYRKPAYILTSDLNTSDETILQYYFLRWDIEVNNRDEKTIFGLGDAQVRSVKSVDRNPQFTVIVYSLLLLASIKAYGANRTDDYLPLPSWRKYQKRRPSTLDIIAQFRREIMQMQLDKQVENYSQSMSKNKKFCDGKYLLKKDNKNSFVITKNESQNVFNLPVDIISALLHADS